MAGENDFLTSIVRLVTGFDDATLGRPWPTRVWFDAPARIWKSGVAITVQELDDSLRFEVPPFEVTMPAAGPAKASCTMRGPRGVPAHRRGRHVAAKIGGRFRQGERHDGRRRRDAGGY